MKLTRDGLRASHARIESLLEEVVRVIETGSLPADAWAAFSAALVAQLDVEDRQLLAARGPDRLARLVGHEHRYLRGRLAELGHAAAELRLRPSELRNFRDVLRAHTRNDERLIDRHGDHG